MPVTDAFILVKPDPTSAKYRATLKAARAAFLELGYEASLDVIARQAGVARRTIFYIFGSKEQLFREIIEEMSAEALPLLILDRDSDIFEALLALARHYTARVVSPEVIAIQRMLLSGGPGFQAHMHTVIERNTLEILADLEAYFAEKVRDGTLMSLNSTHAAERFLASVLGLARVQTMFGIVPDWTDREAYLQDAVRGFLRGVAPNA